MGISVHAFQKHVPRTRRNGGQGECGISVAPHDILRTSQFEIAERDTVWRAVADYGNGKGDFSDYFIAGASAKLGAAETLTFDKGLKADPRFRLLKS